jgi:hypothetical protein
VDAAKLARADTVNAELDRLISKRASQDTRPGPDELEPGYVESVRRHNARRSEEMRAAWCEYHQLQAERLENVAAALAAGHRATAARLREKASP